MRAGDRVDGQYVVQEALGDGVWLAVEEQLDRPVVLKRVELPEPRAIARLNHPHVITLYRLVDDVAVLEYAPGGSLAGRLLPATEAARIGAQIASALAYLHAKGLVHCDVKPGNIVLSESGVAKLTDFGSAYRVDPEATISPVNRLSYTEGYAAPEMERGSPVPASDLYALAVTVCQLADEASPTLGCLLEELRHPNHAERPDAAEARRRFEAIADGVPEPAVTGPVTGSVTGSGPAQLPADVFGFAGRAAELARLDQFVRSAVPVVAITGTAGVGKTALAVHWAHHIAARFPDGQLYANLRGFDPSGQAMDPAGAIRGFLHALGVLPEQIPADLEGQAALYRSALSGKRMLILLDNARDSEHVRPLLPGDPGCLAVVTSRDDLLGLVTKEGARPLRLDVLTETDARQLLDQRLGSDRTNAEPRAVERIVESCARLPLALAIVAARAAARPRFPLASLTNALAGGDPDTDLNAVFSWSYRQLGSEAQRLFRLLGLHPGPDLSAAAAGSLFGGDPPLAELTRAQLIDEHAPGRYTFHDLLRGYAGELARDHDTDEARQAATHRMLDHYLHTAVAAAGHLRSNLTILDGEPARPGVSAEDFGDLAGAMAWFTAEHVVLRAAVELSVAAGFDVHTWKLAYALEEFFYRQGFWPDWVAAWVSGVEAARRVGDVHVRARGQRELCRAYLRMSRFDEALAAGLDALELYRKIGHRTGEAYTHRNLGAVFSEQRRYAEAVEHDRRALELFEEIGDRVGLANAHNNLAEDYALAGDLRQALTFGRSAVELNRELGRPYGEACSLDSVGLVQHRLGEYDQAVAAYGEALDLFRRLGDRYNEADTLGRLGDTRLALGDREAARACWQGALAVLDELGHADAEAVRDKLRRLERAAPNEPMP